jgi:hypothetical protein
VLNNQLAPTAKALLAFQEAEGTMVGLQLLTDLNKNLESPLRYITPAQTTCNYFALTFRQVANASSQGNKYGRWLNFISFAPPEGPNSESGQAAAPANGKDRDNHLHYNPVPNTGAPGQTRGCEAGNEKYEPGKTEIGHAATVWGTKPFNEESVEEGGSE